MNNQIKNTTTAFFIGKCLLPKSPSTVKDRDRCLCRLWCKVLKNKQGASELLDY